jgi:hypothetical protein
MGIVRDVSLGGLFVYTRASARTGTPITVVIAPDARRAEVRVNGTVVRVDAGGIGIEVVQIGALGDLIRDVRLDPSRAETKRR